MSVGLVDLSRILLSVDVSASPVGPIGMLLPRRFCSVILGMADAFRACCLARFSDVSIPCCLGSLLEYLLDTAALVPASDLGT